MAASYSETVVIGAGPAGLTAGYLLAKQGREVTVLEQDEAYVGGISRTVRHNGYLLDIGGHRFVPTSPEVVDLWREILPDGFVERPRQSRIFYGGRYYAYPLKAIEALSNLGPARSAACIASYLWARLRPHPGPKTFHEWVRNRFGETLFSIFFKTYAEKVWGLSCDQVSVDCAAQRITGLSRGGSMLDAVKRSLQQGRAPAPGASKPGEPVVDTLVERFHYPRRGPGMLWEEAARKMVSFGGRLNLGRRVERLHFDPEVQLWTVTACLADGSHETIRARHVVSSAPIAELMAAIQPVPLSLFNARALRYRDFLTVALILRTRVEIEDTCIYVHDPAVKVARIQNFRSWSPDMLPDQFHSCLGLEYFCFEEDGLWQMSDADLVELAGREIERIGLVSAGHVVDACVVRQPKACPVYDDTCRDDVSTVRLDLAQTYPGLHLVGRNGMHRDGNQDHAMMTAMLTVENIVAGAEIYDAWQVNEDAAYVEQGTSGAQGALGRDRPVPHRAEAAGRAA